MSVFSCNYRSKSGLRLLLSILKRKYVHSQQDNEVFGIEKEKKGKSKKTWSRQVEAESVKVGLRRENAHCRSMWSVGVNQIAADVR